VTAFDEEIAKLGGNVAVDLIRHVAVNLLGWNPPKAIHARIDDTRGERKAEGLRG
jgi:hypothetical protein